MKRREMGRTKLPALAATLLLLAAGPAVAQETICGDVEIIGEVVWTVGRVTGQPPGGAIGVLASTDPVCDDMTVRTGVDSGAGVNLGTGMTIKIPALETEVVVKPGRFELLKGYVEAWVRSFRDGESPGGETENTTIGVEGTGFGVRYADGTTTVWAFEALGNDLTVTSKLTGESVFLETGQVTVVAGDSGPTPPIPFDPKTGAAGGLVLPFPPDPPDVFDEPPLPPGDNDLPPGRGNEPGPPVIVDDTLPPRASGGNEPGDDG